MLDPSIHPSIHPSVFPTPPLPYLFPRAAIAMGDRSRTSIQPNEEPQSETNTRNHCDKVMTAEPVSRSRWMPKPEQILILESIFNSGMVNPPKDETVRIRKLLEKFGAVGDANVFYWFQNRRSRSRRRQRQMQAAMAADPRLSPVESRQLSRGAILCSPSSCLQQASPSSTSSSSSNPSTGGGGVCASTAGFLSPSSAAGTGGCFSSSCGLLGDDGADDLFTISRQMGFPELGESKPILLNSSSPDLHYQSAGPITVFINGVPSEVPRGPMDMRAVFGNDVMLVHSSGEVVPTTEGGVLFQGLQMGESYFLVTKPTL